MYDREEYEWYKTHGICVRCRKAKARSGRTTCAACAAQNTKRTLRYFNEMTARCARNILSEPPRNSVSGVTLATLPVCALSAASDRRETTAGPVRCAAASEQAHGRNRWKSDNSTPVL